MKDRRLTACSAALNTLLLCAGVGCTSGPAWTPVGQVEDSSGAEYRVEVGVDDPLVRVRVDVPGEADDLNVRVVLTDASGNAASGRIQHAPAGFSSGVALRGDLLFHFPPEWSRARVRSLTLWSGGGRACAFPID